MIMNKKETAERRRDRERDREKVTMRHTYREKGDREGMDERDWLAREGNGGQMG